MPRKKADAALVQGTQAVAPPKAMKSSRTVTTDDGGFAIGRIQLNDTQSGIIALAATVLELLPAIPTRMKPTGLSTTPGMPGLNKAVYRSIAEQCARLAHAEEGLFANFIDTMVEANASGYETRLAGDDPTKTGDTPESRYMAIFDQITRFINADQKTGQAFPGKERGMFAVQRKFVWNWWVTGLFVSLYRWEPVLFPEIDRRSFRIPVDLTVLDSLRIDLDDYASKGIVWYEYAAEQKAALLQEIKDYGGPQNHPILSLLPATVDKNKPAERYRMTPADAMKELQSKSRIPLPWGHFKVVRRVFNDSEVYPVPFGARVFSAINDKRMLRNMDRSVIRKVVMMILQIVTKRNQQKVKPRVSQGAVDQTVAAIEASFQADNDYLKVIGLPDDSEMSWVTPDAKAILDPDKYRTVDFEILSSLIGLVAAQLLDGNGGIDISMVGEQLWRKNNLCSTRWKEYVEEHYDQTIEMNSLRQIRQQAVQVVIRSFNMFQSDAFKVFISTLVMRGLFPVKLAADHIGEDYATIVAALIKEKNWNTEFGIFAAPPTNVQTDIASPGENTPPVTKESGPSPGRKTGTPNTKPSTKPTERDDGNTNDNPPASK